MRVTTNNIAEFLECLLAETQVYQNVVRVSIARHRWQNNEAKFEVVIQASAVIEVADGDEQYLLEGGEIAGYDYDDEEPTQAGTERARALKQDIQAATQERGWKVLPGLIEI